MTDRPLFHEIIHQMVKATIWYEEFEGSISFNVAFSRLSRESEHWSDSAYFQLEDMGALGEVALAVQSWIREQSFIQGLDGKDGNEGAS